MPSAIWNFLNFSYLEIHKKYAKVNFFILNGPKTKKFSSLFLMNGAAKVLNEKLFLFTFSCWKTLWMLSLSLPIIVKVVLTREFSFSFFFYAVEIKRKIEQKSFGVCMLKSTGVHQGIHKGIHQGIHQGTHSILWRKKKWKNVWVSGIFSSTVYIRTFIVYKVKKWSKVVGKFCPLIIISIIVRKATL